MCEYRLEAENLTDVTARARELLGGHLIADGTLPASVEDGCRLQPPDAPWAPLQEQVRHASCAVRTREFCGWQFRVPQVFVIPVFTTIAVPAL